MISYTDYLGKCRACYEADHQHQLLNSATADKKDLALLASKQKIEQMQNELNAINGNFAFQYLLDQNSTAYQQRLTDSINFQLQLQKDNKPIPGDEQTPFGKTLADLPRNTFTFISQEVVSEHLEGIEQLDYLTAVNFLKNEFNISEQNARVILTCHHQGAIQDYNLLQLTNVNRFLKSSPKPELKNFTFYTENKDGQLVIHSYLVHFPLDNADVPEVREGLIKHLLALEQAKKDNTPRPVNHLYSILIEESFTIEVTEQNSVSITNYHRNNSYEFQQYCNEIFDFSKLTTSPKAYKEKVQQNFNFKLNNTSTNLIEHTAQEYNKNQAADESIIAIKYFFNQLSSENYIQYVENSFYKYLYTQRASATTTSHGATFIRDVRQSNFQNYPCIWIKKENSITPLASQSEWTYGTFESRINACVEILNELIAIANDDETEKQKIENALIQCDIDLKEYKDNNEKVVRAVIQQNHPNPQNNRDEIELFLQNITAKLNTKVSKLVDKYNRQTTPEDHYYIKRNDIKKPTAQEIVISLSKTYGISLENATLLINFQQQAPGCLLAQSNALFRKANGNFERDIGHRHDLEIQQIQDIILFEEDSDGCLIYKCFLVDCTAYNDTEKFKALVENLKAGKIDESAVLSIQSFKMTSIPGQDVPKISDYTRQDTNLFEERRKKHFSDLPNTSFKDFLSAVAYRPLDKKTYATVAERIHDINDISQLYTIFEGLPPFRDESENAKLLGNTFAEKDLAIQTKQLAEFCKTLLETTATEFDKIKAGIKNVLNTLPGSPLRGLDQAAVDNALLFSYYYHVVLKNIISLLPGSIKQRDIDNLLKIATQTFVAEKQSFAYDLPFEQYLREVKNKVTSPSKKERSFGTLLSARATKLDTIIAFPNKRNAKIDLALGNLGRIFDDFPLQQNPKNEFRKLKNIFHKFQSLLTEDTQLKLLSHFEKKDVQLDPAMKALLSELQAFLIVAASAAGKQLFDFSGNMHAEIKTSLVNDYGCDIDKWIEHFGKDTVYNALFSSYFNAIRLGFINDKLPQWLIDNGYSEDAVPIFGWLFSKLSTGEFYTIARPIALLQNTAKDTAETVLEQSENVVSEKTHVFLTDSLGAPSDQQKQARSNLADNPLPNKIEEKVVQIDTQLHDFHQNFNYDIEQINQSPDQTSRQKETSCKKLLLNQSRELYLAQLDWQKLSESTKLSEPQSTMLKSAIDGAQQQQGQIQELLFLNKTFPTILIDRLAIVLNLQHESSLLLAGHTSLFSNAESVIGVAKSSHEANFSNLISKLTDDSTLTNKQLAQGFSQIPGNLNTQEAKNKWLAEQWQAIKKTKPSSYFDACINTAKNWFRPDHKKVNGIDELEYIDKLHSEINAYLLKNEFELNVMRVIDAFRFGKISQNEVIALLTKVTNDSNFQLHIPQKVRQLKDFCQSFSKLIGQYEKLYDNGSAPAITLPEKPHNPPNNNLDPDDAPIAKTVTPNTNTGSLVVKYAYRNSIFKEVLDEKEKISINPKVINHSVAAAIHAARIY